MQCTSCGFENPEGMSFCGKCGTWLFPSCPQCGFANPADFAFCGKCGSPLARPLEKSQPAKGEAKAAPKRTMRKRRSQTTRPAAEEPHSVVSEAERRQLTVMFCDLVGSTSLAERLDPEEYREIVRACQESCEAVIQRYDGHLAQYLGDGILVYFGYPAAHEDEARRAVRTGLEILAGLQSLNAQLSPALHARLPHPVHVRIGIHTGPVVVGEMGGGERRERLALGETPNVAARLQGLAEPNTVVISAATQRLLLGLFDCQDLGRQEVKGLSAPLQAYRVLSESHAQSGLEVDVSTGKLTPLVGRANEIGLILERWAAAQAGDGQVVLVSGEPGIGKSRLVQEVKERLVQQQALCLEFRCSPYAQNSAFAPVLTHLQRLLQFERDDRPQDKLAKLRQALTQYRFPQTDTLSLLAALLSLPHPEGVPALMLSPQKQKQKTQEALVAWLVEDTERRPMYCVWEDLHWADPSTLELLGLLLDQVPTIRMLMLLTARPEFIPPWSSRTHLIPLSLSRLPRTQAGEMVEKVTGGKPLPAEVQQQIVSKTDGVPLFVEELTKMVVESGIVKEQGGSYTLTGPLPPLAIPTTLYDSLMARLDRLVTAREVAQVGATLGREFSYELLRAVSPVEEACLQQALTRLVEAEVLYQRGLPPQTRYIFKHALIQDAAYQSLLKSRRQQLHEQVAHVLAEKFPQTIETQPEIVAHHYTEAGLIAQAIPYWQRAGQRAMERSANVEAISHLTKGLEVVKVLPDTERVQQELVFQTALGPALMATRGFAALEVGEAYTRALELCRKVGQPSQLSSVLGGLWGYYAVRGEVKPARELGEQLLGLAQKVQDPLFFSEAYYELGFILLFKGEFASARTHLEQGLAFYEPQQHRSDALVYGYESRVTCAALASWVLWYLGYPDQGLKRMREALTLARGLSHPYSLALTLLASAILNQFRREVQLVQEQADAMITLSTEQGFAYWLAWGAILKGWMSAGQGHKEEGIGQLCQGLAAYRATGAELWRSYQLALLIEAYRREGRAAEGLSVLSEALVVVDRNEERFYEAELYRLKGTLTLETSPTSSQASSLKPQVSEKVEREAEECFLKAIEIAQRQQAKSLELRAVMSLVRLRQHQAQNHATRTTQHEARARLDEAHIMLSEVYNWFTEGFDTKDLQEATVLLEEFEGREDLPRSKISI
jgi:class 3 adenylate cyclase/predicted ATPase